MAVRGVGKALSDTSATGGRRVTLGEKKNERILKQRSKEPQQGKKIFHECRGWFIKPLTTMMKKEISGKTLLLERAEGGRSVGGKKGVVESLVT